MNNSVTIGKILKPRGLAGEVKVQVLFNKPKAIEKISNIEKVSFSGGFAYIKFKGINSIEAAESLRGQLIKIPRNLLPLDSDEVLSEDLVGFKVIDENRKELGTVQKIETVGGSEVFDCGNFMFPYEDAFVLETNIAKRQIVVKAEMLESEIIL